MKIKFAMVITVLFISFSNCKKDKLESPGTLTSKTWKWGVIDKNPSTNPRGKIIYHSVNKCERDDTFKFGKDGKLTINKHSDKCDQNEIKIVTQHYTLDTVSKELIIDGTKYSLAEASRTQIKYYSTIPEVTGYEYLIYLLQ